MPMILLRSSAAIFVFLAGIYVTPATGASWESTLTASSPGGFPPPRPMHAKYRFGWSGLTAGTLDIRLTKSSGDRFQVEATGRTIGLARALWRFDANHTSITDAGTLHPIEVKQTEIRPSKKIVTNLTFESNRVTSRRSETPGKNETPKMQHFDFSDLFDLQSAVLYLRSQPLQERSVQRIVVYPASSAYLAIVTVLGRERINTPAGSFNAIKLDLQLNKVGKNRELEPHRKFRRATGWISDDADRLLLRLEAQIFVGSVSAELHSVEFENAKARP